MTKFALTLTSPFRSHRHGASSNSEVVAIARAAFGVAMFSLTSSMPTAATASTFVTVFAAMVTCSQTIAYETHFCVTCVNIKGQTLAHRVGLVDVLSVAIRIDSSALLRTQPAQHDSQA